jgi:hypothetical protein
MTSWFLTAAHHGSQIITACYFSLEAFGVPRQMESAVWCLITAGRGNGVVGGCPFVVGRVPDHFA